MRIVDASIRTSLFKRTLTLSDIDRAADFIVPGRNLPFAPKPINLWSEDAQKQFDSCFGSSGIASDLDKRMFNRAGPTILRVPAAEADLVPWEAFQRQLDTANRRKLAIVRAIDQDKAFRFDKTPSRMRILALVGHPGDDTAFDPGNAQTFLTSVFNAAVTANPRVERAVVTQLRRQNLADCISVVTDLNPNVLLFFGHGGHSPPRIRLAAGDDGWMELGAFVDEVFMNASQRPAFWIFWACSLAENANQPDQHLDSPQMLSVLGERGGIAALAMRSRIQIRTARVMLEALLSAIAAGEPLEIAAGLSRAACLESFPETRGRMDYAAPAVWSRSEPVDRITWGADEAFPASWVALPLIATGNEFPEFAAGSADVDDVTASLAETWATPGRFFISTSNGGESVEDVAVRARLVGVAAMIRKRTGRPVVPVFLRTGTTFDQRLGNWAGDAHGYLDPRFHDRELAMAIASIATERLNGLSRLLAIPEVVVIFSEPPDRSAGWDVLANTPTGSSVVVLGRFPSAETAGWILDTLMFRPNAEELSNIIVEEPLGCAILGVIERPIALREVERMTGSSAGALDRLDPLLVRVGSRRVLAETVRKTLRDNLDKNVVVEAREKCIHFLSENSVEHDFDATVEVCNQHLALGRDAAAAEVVNAAWAVCGDLWSVQKRLRLFNLAATRAKLCDLLQDDLLLALAQAAVTAQETQVARLVLEAFRPRSATHKARRHAMLAECLKADAGRPAAIAGMWRHANDALVSAEAAVAAGEGMTETDVLAFRHDLARLEQYFRHDYQGALKLYQDIRDLLRTQAKNDMALAYLFAASSRNAAECLLDPAQRPLDPTIREQAEDLVEEGLGMVSMFSLKQVEAELLYTRARIAEAAGDDIAAAGLLAQLASGSSARNYPLLAAIANDRLAWNEQRQGRRVFSWEDLEGRLRMLDLFDHSWAARVAIKTRLRAAKLLYHRGSQLDLDRARQLLEENHREFRRLTHLSGGEDAQNAAGTFSGLDVLSGGSRQTWREFLVNPLSQRISEEWKKRTAKEMWEAA
ncbi:hypothetical protein HGP17_14880 [Rhizobium sp. P38BS-XIX]|uniref:hypothetical protein n=1 Tax=Rhizobium sp. P38BS-XIX TaxID=2726740 RepID=UPI001456A8AF|nr:hypothetical protein [Rhizobium sp. P38BS-XIX]NLR98097.1 hypothetical protein [Rhizobium sp. P38BS-XIX]